MKKRSKFRAHAAAALVAVTIWTYLALDSETWIVTSPRLPSAFDNWKISLLTDLHGVELGEGNRRLLRAVEQEKPDLIAISGDLLHENTDPAMLEPLLKGLTAIAPTCFVTGNHEWGRDDTEAILTTIAEYGVTVLRNDYFLLQREGQTLVIAGAEDPVAYADLERPGELAARIRREVGGDPYTVMVSHRNDRLDTWAAAEVDLVLAGHGHGGVIRLPVIGGLLGVNRNFFPDDAEGLYEKGRTTLAVSRGLGGIRLWNRPHLPTIVLKYGE